MNNQEVAAKLRQIYGAAAPRVVNLSGRLDDWPVVAACLLARSNYALESVIALQERTVDAAVLTRCLYEHVLTFAWIAINPNEHLPRFLKSEYEERRKARNGFAEFDDVPLPAEVTIAELAQFARGVHLVSPPVPECAREVDSHWGRILEGFSQGRDGFMGMFVVLYRHFSSYVHPTTAGIFAFSGGTPTRVTVGRPRDVGRPPLGIATLLFAQGLLVASDQLGWPDRDAIVSAFEPNGAQP